MSIVLGQDPRIILQRLTRRQLQCMRLRCQGRTEMGAARELHISADTVKNHTTAALKSLEMSSVDEVCYALGRCDERFELEVFLTPVSLVFSEDVYQRTG